MHLSRAAASMAALQDGMGRLITNVTRLPHMVADYWDTNFTAPDNALAKVRTAALGVLGLK